MTHKIDAFKIFEAKYCTVRAPQRVFQFPQMRRVRPGILHFAGVVLCNMFTHLGLGWLVGWLDARVTENQPNQSSNLFTMHAYLLPQFFSFVCRHCFLRLRVHVLISDSGLGGWWWWRLNDVNARKNKSSMTNKMKSLTDV